MSKFQLARLRRLALMGEYLLWCVPSDEWNGVAAYAMQHMTSEQMVAAILDARGD